MTSPGEAAGVAGGGAEVRRWAAAHAATVARPGAAPQVAVTRPEATPRPAVLSSFTQVGEIDTGFWTNAVAWTLHPDGRLLLATGGYTGDGDGRIAIWDYGTGSQFQTLTWEPAGSEDWRTTTADLAWGQEAGGRSLLAAIGYDGWRVWDLDSGELVNVVEAGGRSEPSPASGSVAWGRQPDGRLLLAGSAVAQDAVWVWDPGSGQPARRLTGYSGTAGAAAWVQRPDGRLALAVGEGSGAVQICDPDTGQVLETLTGHRESVRAMASTSETGRQPAPPRCIRQ